MSTQDTPVNAIDPDGTWLYRAGGISALVFGIALYVPMGARPSGAEAWLAYIAGNTTAWRAILVLSILTDFILVPIALSFYLVLKEINRKAMLVATAFVGLFVVLDLALTWTNLASLITLSGNYAEAANDAQRAIFVAIAYYPAMVVDSNLLFVYNSLTLAVGILMTGLVMRKGIFSKSTANLGLATGILGVISVASSFLPAR